MDDDPLPYKIKIKFSRNSEGLSVAWLDENLAGRWSVGRGHEYYDLMFEYEEDALLTWWKWG